MKYQKLFCIIIVILPFFNGTSIAQKSKSRFKSSIVTPGLNDRQYWLLQLDKMARPVLYNLANDSLKINMPIILSMRSDNAENRTRASYLEAFARTMCGISPWLNLETGSADEIKLRSQFRTWALKATSNAVNPSANDYMEWQKGGQPLVDASFLALSFLRCPWLWKNLDDAAKGQVVSAFKLTRSVTPPFQNWILFTGMIEAFFCHFNLEWDAVRVEYGLRQFEQWYVGDGVYSDGPSYAWDYYNSYVIHPYLSKITEVVSKKNNSYIWATEKLKERNDRYAIIQERLISSDGSFPATGRSLVYRGAAFHHLADMALQKKLPADLKPAQVRGALTAVIKKTMDCTNTYTKNGWLNIGLCGSQPELADVYNTTGSLYLCSTILLPLGLPDTDEFWASPPMPFTAQRVWNGEDTKGDHSIH